MRGAIAKEKAIEKIKEAFGQDYLGIQDKKVYILADDGGEQHQLPDHHASSRLAEA